MIPNLKKKLLIVTTCATKIKSIASCINTQNIIKTIDFRVFFIKKNLNVVNIRISKKT